MILKIVERPSIRHTTLFSGQPELRQNIVKNNSIRFIIRHETKTQLSLSIHSGTTSFKVNSVSDYAKQKNLTFVTKTEMNYFHGQTESNHYFKLTKKQNMGVLFDHIESLTRGLILRDLYIDKLVDKNTFVIEVEMPDDLLELSPLKIGDTQLCEVGI